MKRLLIFFGLLACTIVLGAQTPAERMREANDAFQSKNYDRAASIYETLYAAGYSSATLFYNLGNSHYRQGNLGRAILNYERALLYQSNNENVKHNLAIARRQLRDELESLPEFFLWRWWRNLAFSLPITVWSLFGVLLLWLGAGGMVLWLFARERKNKIRGFTAGLCLGVCCILPFALASSRVRLQNNSGTAIILVTETLLRSAPDPQSADILEVHEGLKVTLLDQISDWHKVRLQNGEEGWLPKEALEEI